MKGNEARVVFFLHPVDQLRDGQVSKVKPSRSSFGVGLLLLLGLLVGIAVLVYVSLDFGVQARSQQRLVSAAAAEVSPNTTVTEDGQYDKSDKNVTTAVTERTTETTTNRTRGNDSIAETKMPTKATLPGTNLFLAALTALQYTHYTNPWSASQGHGIWT